MNRAGLELRAARWRRHHQIRTLMFALAAGLAAAAMVARASSAMATVAAIGAGAAIWVWHRWKTPAVDAATIAAHLDRVCPVLEESATLWLRDPGSLDLVARLQLARLDAAWMALPTKDALGHPTSADLRPPVAAMLAAVAAVTFAIAWPTPVSERVAADARPANAGVVSVTNPIALTDVTLRVEPPAYLEHPARIVNALDGELAAGSRATWHLAFSGNITGIALRVAGTAEEIAAVPLGDGRFQATYTIDHTLLYQLVVEPANGSRAVWPEIHAIKAIPDTPPQVSWVVPTTARTLIDPVQAMSASVRLAVTDDHRVARVHLVATVAKGSGEGVKFREQEIPLAPEAPIADGASVFGRTLDLAALGMEPGDELYFHALASDLRSPAPNVTRSEARFIVLQGPDTDLTQPGTAIAGVNLVPQYFRSQRQLIIDTERLLAERAELSEEQFRARSEDIGVDQKLLRLRYGQFLGEEFAPDAAGAPETLLAESAPTTSALTPDHDRGAATREAAIERAVEAQHAGHAESVERDGRPKTLEEIAAPFVHQHDVAEAASLHDVQVKASLRGVLAAMWEAEGFLRTIRPAEALPAENRALELLKALQQADRVYVKRIGFEPAPVRIDERRLRGDLADIPAQAVSTLPRPLENEAVTAVRRALTLLGEQGLHPGNQADDRLVAAALASAAQNDPGRFVQPLEIWKRHGLNVSDPDQRRLVRAALWTLMPPSTITPARERDASDLGRRYSDALGR